MTQILNISAYRFTPISDTAALRESIRSQAAAACLKGTVLLAPEGINLFLAGGAQALRAFVDWLRADTRFAALETKESWSRDVPFGKLLVKATGSCTSSASSRRRCSHTAISWPARRWSATAPAASAARRQPW